MSIKNYYKIPLKIGSMIDDKLHLEKSDITNSIKYFIHLIFKTHFKEYRYDYNFGSIIWEKDFEKVNDVESWKIALTKALAQPIIKYEKRLIDVKVSATLDEQRYNDPSNTKLTEVRKRIVIMVSGLLLHTNEPFQHLEVIYFSPMSIV